MVAKAAGLVKSSADLTSWLAHAKGAAAIEAGVLTLEDGTTFNLRELAETDERVARLLPLLRAAVRAQVVLHKKLREIEEEFYLVESSYADEFVSGASLACDVSDDVDTEIGHVMARDFLANAEFDEDEDEE